MTAAQNSYSKWIVGLSLASGGLAILVSYLERAGVVPGVLKPVVALLPILPLIGMFVGFSRWLRALDELQRLIHLEAFVIQFAATGVLVMGYGMLAKSGVVADLRATEAYPFVWLAIFGFWALGFLVVRRKYQ